MVVRDDAWVCLYGVFGDVLIEAVWLIEDRACGQDRKGAWLPLMSPSMQKFPACIHAFHVYRPPSRCSCIWRISPETTDMERLQPDVHSHGQHVQKVGQESMLLELGEMDCPFLLFLFDGKKIGRSPEPPGLTSPAVVCPNIHVCTCASYSGPDGHNGSHVREDVTTSKEHLFDEIFCSARKAGDCESESPLVWCRHLLAVHIMKALSINSRLSLVTSLELSRLYFS